MLMQHCLPQKCPLEDNSKVGNSELVFLQNFPPQSLFVLLVCAGMTYIGLCYLDKGSKYQVSHHNPLRIPCMRQASRR